MAITSKLPPIYLRLEPKDHQRLKELARQNERKLVQEARLAVKRHLEREELSTSTTTA